MKRNSWYIKSMVFVFVPWLIASCADQGKGPFVVDTYPNLATGILMYARLAPLDGDRLLESDGIVLTEKDLGLVLDMEYPPYLRTQIEKNIFFALERSAVTKLLAVPARKTKASGDTADEGDAIERYLEGVVKNVKATEREIEEFYRDNPQYFVDTELNFVRDRIADHINEQKKQEAVFQHVRGFGKKTVVYVSESWVKAHCDSSYDNPVNTALASGKGSFVAFSSAGCCGPDTVLPLLDELRERFGDTINIVYVDAKQEQILAARFNVISLPTFIFYDAAGAERAKENGNQTAEKLIARINDAIL